MGLRSGKSKNRKLNRADTGRSANRRADFYDLRSGSGAESEYPAGEGERYYEDEITEDINGESRYGSAGRYPDYTNFTASSDRSDRSGGSARPEDERPYRERHRVEMNDGAYTRSSGSYNADRGPEVPSLSRSDGRRTSGTSGYERNRYGTGSSSSYGGGSSTSYSSNGAGSPGFFEDLNSYSNGSGSSTSYGGENRVVRGNVPANRRDSVENGAEREISADLFVPNTFSGSGRRSRVTRRSRESIQDSRGGSYRDSTSDRPYRDSAYDSSSRGGAYDSGYRGRASDRPYRGDAYGSSSRSGSYDSSYRGGASDRSYRGGSYGSSSRSSSYGSSSRSGSYDSSSRSGSYDSSYRSGASDRAYRAGSSGSDSMGAGSDRFRNSRTAAGRTQESGPGFYSAPGYLGGSRRGSGTGTRTGDNYRRDGGSGRRGGTDPGQDYFYEEELPADNLLWDGIGDDPDETPAQKRARQRERIRQEREKELRKMYFRLGAGAAVAMVAIIIVIVIAVIGLRSKDDDNTAAAGSGTEQTTVASGNETDSSAGSGPEGDVGEENSPQTEQTNGDEDLSQDARDNQEGTADGPQDASDETAEEPDMTNTTDTTGADTENGGRQEGTAGQQENTAADTENPADQGNTQLSPTDSWTEEARQGIAADGNGAGVSYTRQDEWNLILVNPWHKLPEGYTVETTTLLNGESIDSRCYSALSQMLNDCQELSGGIPIVCSSYRPHEKQVLLYDDQVKSLMSAGKTKEEAEKEAGTVVAVPGTSEHELGLAVDICDSENQLLDESQADTNTQKWLMENCWKYGFILRYPKNKSDITGIIYEPWHYRYVGNEVAREIQESGICLEEYLAE